MEHLFSRRDMMKGLGAAALAMGLEGLFSSANGSTTKGSTESRQLGECRLPPLPYPYDALEPFLDKETLAIHHDKHHAGYVKNFNVAMKKLEEARISADYALIKHWSREFAFNGSGHVLHTLYWSSMAPEKSEPKGDLLASIERSFGGLERLKTQFLAAAKAVEGSGWGILAYEPYRGHLVVLQAEKHQDLTIWGVIPLLVCDVWEHAYYLKYQNRRAEYVDNFFGFINWHEVEKRFMPLRGMAAYGRK